MNIDIIKRDTGRQRIGNIDILKSIRNALESLGHGYMDFPFQHTIVELMVFMAAVSSTTGSLVVLLYNYIAAGVVVVCAVEACIVEAAMVPVVSFPSRACNRGRNIEL